MATIRIRDQDNLEEASNFGVGKTRTTFMLDENGLKEYAENVVAIPTYTQQQETYKKEMAKGKSMILYGVQYHVIKTNVASLITKKRNVGCQS